MIRRERRPINPEALQRIRDFLEVGLDDGDEAFLKRVEEEDTESSSSASEESSVASSDESASDQHSEADKEDEDNEKQKNARKAKVEAKRKEQAALREKRKLEKEERKRRRAEEKGDSDSDRSVGSDDFGSNAGHDSSASEFTCSERDSELSSDDDDFSGKNGGKKKKSKKMGGAKKDKVSRAEREARRATREEERKEKKKRVGGGSGGSGGGKEDNTSHNKTAKTHQRNGTKKQQPSEAEIRAHNMMKRHAGAEAMAKLEGQVAKEFSQSARMKRASFREVESTNALRDMENRYTVGVKGGDEDGDGGGGISGLAGGVVVGKGSKGSGRKRGAASGSSTYTPSSNEASSSRNLTRLNSATTPAFNTHVLAPIALLEGVGVPSLLTQLEKLKTAQSLSVGGMGKSSPDLKRRRIDKEGVSDIANSDPTRENNNNNNKTGSSFDSSSSAAAAAVASSRYDDPFTALKDRLIMLTYNVTPTTQPQQQQHQASAQSGTTSSLPSSSINCTDGVSGLSTSFATPSNSATSASVACVKDILRRPFVRSFAHLGALERYEAWEESVETDTKLSSRRGRSAHPASGVKMLMMKVGGLSVDVLNALGQKNHSYNNLSRTNEPVVTTITSTDNSASNNNNCSFHDYDEFYGEEDENYSSNKNRKGSDSDDDNVKEGGEEDYVHGGGAALCSRGGNVATYLSGLGGHTQQSSSSSFGFSRLKFKSIFGEEGALSVEALSTCIQQQLQGGGDVLSCLPTLYPSCDHSASQPQNDGNSNNNKTNGLVGGTIATRRFTPALFVNPNSSENTYPLFQAHELASVL